MFPGRGMASELFKAFLAGRRWQILPVFAAKFSSFQKLSHVSEEIVMRL